MGVHLYTNGAWIDSGRIYRKSLNLYNYREIVPGYTYNSDGEMILNPDEVNRWKYAAVPLIEVDSSETYLRTYNLSPIGNVVNFYDSNKNFLEQLSPGTGAPFVTSFNCKFVSFVFNIELYDSDKYMFTKGATVPPQFEVYGVDWYTNNGHSYSSGAWS